MTPIIDSYRFGEIVIDGRVYQKDVIIFPDRVLTNWRRAAGHCLSLADLDTVLAAPPAALILGQGAYGRMAVPQSVRETLEGRGIQVYAHPTQEACDLYNKKRATALAAAALHLTC